MRADIPPAERCLHCRGFGWVLVSHDPDIDVDCGACNGTGHTSPQHDHKE